MDPEVLEFLDALTKHIAAMSAPTKQASDMLDSLNLSKLRELASGFDQVKSLATIALTQVHQLVSQIQSQFASFVQLYDPSAMIRFDMAVRDLNGSIGEALLPVFNRATAVIRGLADAIAGMSPNAKTMIAGLGAAAVSMAVMTIATQALSAVVASATGGLSLIVGAIVGGVVAIGSVTGTFDQFQNAIGPLVNILSTSMTMLGESFSLVTKGAEPLIQLLGSGLQTVMAGVLPIMNQFAERITGVMANVLPILENLLPPVLSVFTAIGQFGMAQLQLVTTFLNPVLQLLAPVTEVLGVIVTAASAGFQGIVAVLQAVMSVLEPVLQLFTVGARIFSSILGEMQKALGPAFAELQSSLSDLGSVFGEVGQILSLAVAQLVPIFVDLLKPVTEFLVGVAREFASIITEIAKFVQEMADELRGLFNIEKPKAANASGASQGKAIRDVSQGGIEDIIKRAQQAAFSIGTASEDPNKQTAKNTSTTVSSLNMIATDIKEFKAKFEAFATPVLVGFGKFIDAASNPVQTIRTTAADVAEKGVERLNKLNPLNWFGD